MRNCPRDDYRQDMQRRFFIRRNLAHLALRLARWRAVGTVPPSGILVGAPHTSNWDWVMAILLCWSNSIQPHLLVKKELFIGPLGWLLRATGSVPLDRKNPHDTVAALLAEAQTTTRPFFVALAAEGTRGTGTYWKSGFRRLAQQTGLPIALAFIDAPNRTTGWGPSFHPSEDVTADMDILREFYADKTGFNHENFIPPLLREEVEGPSRPEAT